MGVEGSMIKNTVVGIITIAALSLMLMAKEYVIEIPKVKALQLLNAQAVFIAALNIRDRLLKEELERAGVTLSTHDIDYLRGKFIPKGE